MIKEQSNQFSLRLMCRLLSVSVSGYYGWHDRTPSRREEENRRLAIKIKEIFDDEKARAGALRITKRLNNEGTQVGRHRIEKIMRSNSWRARAAKRFKATTNSNHSLPVAPNLSQQNFLAHQSNKKWVSDITYGVPGARGKQGGLNGSRIYLKYPEHAQGVTVH